MNYESQESEIASFLCVGRIEIIIVKMCELLQPQVHSRKGHNISEEK